jgi:hypothetical protein
MPAAEELKALVNQVPDPDKNGTYVNMDQEKIDTIRRLVPEFLKGGRDTVLGLIDMLVEPGKGSDVKPHFALHLLAVHVTGLADDKARAAFALAVASQIGGDRPKAVQKYLIQELRLAGGKLAAIRDGAAEQLLAALPKVQGRNRLAVIKKLAVLRCEEAAEAFRQALGDADADIRIGGAWGIARIADASAADALLKMTDAHQGWERFNENDACVALAEGLMAKGKKAEAVAIYAHLQKTRTGPTERHIREAAERALAAAK